MPHRPGHAEVAELEVAVPVDHDVGGLDVPVDDAPRLAGLEGAGDVAARAGRVARVGLPAPEPPRERREELHADVDVAPGVPGVRDLRDVAAGDDVGVGERRHEPVLAQDLVGLLAVAPRQGALVVAEPQRAVPVALRGDAHDLEGAPLGLAGHVALYLPHAAVGAAAEAAHGPPAGPGDLYV